MTGGRSRWQEGGQGSGDTVGLQDPQDTHQYPTSGRSQGPQVQAEELTEK